MNIARVLIRSTKSLMNIARVLIYKELDEYCRVLTLTQGQSNRLTPLCIRSMRLDNINLSSTNKPCIVYTLPWSVVALVQLEKQETKNEKSYKRLHGQR